MDLNQLQNLMENLYGEDDRNRGLPSTVAWLCEEVGELAQAVRKAVSYTHLRAHETDS